MQWLIVQYLLQQTAHALIIICHVCPFHMFWPLQCHHHQGGIYKGIQVQQILWKMCTCRVKIQHCQLKLLEMFKIYIYISCDSKEKNILSSIAGKHLH